MDTCITEIKRKTKQILYYGAKEKKYDKYHHERKLCNKQFSLWVWFFWQLQALYRLYIVIF